MNAVSRASYWQGLTKNVKDYVRSCSKCQANKPSNTSYGLYLLLQIANGRWHTDTMDFCGPFVISGKGEWVRNIVVVDGLTERAHFIPSHNSDTATEVARWLFNEIVRLHGLPSNIISNQDAKFTSLFWKSLFERLGTRLAMSTAYHPQTDGQCERMVRTFKEMLCSVVNYWQSNWTSHLAAYDFAYNNLTHPATGMTPFELDTGTHPRTPYPVYKADGPDVNNIATFIEQLNALHNFALEKVEMTRQKQAEAENKEKPRPITFQESQLVLLSTKNAHVSPPFLKEPGSNKLRANYIGPFAVTQRV